MNRRRLLMNGGFPREPSEYELLQKYTAAGTFTAPKKGWYQIEVHGASGNGGEPYDLEGKTTGDLYRYTLTSGGGGGGGGYACSRVRLEKDDTVTFTPGKVGAISSASIFSTIEEYEDMAVTSGGNGGKAKGASTVVGTGGVASGGNYENANGKNGNRQSKSDTIASGEEEIYAVVKGAGGAAGHSGGNAGGNGEGCVYDTSQYIDDVFTVTPATKGSAGFIKIYRGNKN